MKNLHEQKKALTKIITTLQLGPLTAESTVLAVLTVEEVLCVSSAFPLYSLPRRSDRGERRKIREREKKEAPSLIFFLFALKVLCILTPL